MTEFFRDGKAGLDGEVFLGLGNFGPASVAGVGMHGKPACTRIVIGHMLDIYVIRSAS